MSIYYRKQNYQDIIFKKNLHLKHISEKLFEVMPKNFSFKDFLSAFKECYPCQWEDIVRYCMEKKNDFYRRSRKGLRTIPYYTPEQYLKHTVHMRSLSKYLNEQDRKNKYASLVLKGQKKKRQRNDKLASNLVFVQEVCPPYIKQLIKSYFKTRKTSPLNINARYLILLEATQFRCDETIEFLNKINACEKNNDLREMAFYSLQRLGENPWLSKKCKGKRRLSMLKPIDVQKNPTELIQLIYTNQHMLYQEYDVFLSHSSLDVNELLQLKVLLNQQGKTVYIDWVNDRVMLNRQNQNQDTWKVLELRMDQSKTLLYVMTDNSIKSPCTEREIMYFKNASKSIKVYKPYIFYLWNDVFKDYEFGDSIFDDGKGGKLTFDKFYTVAEGNTKVVEENVVVFLSNLGLQVIENEIESVPDDISSSGLRIKVNDREVYKYNAIAYTAVEEYVKLNQDKSADEVARIWDKFVSCNPTSWFIVTEAGRQTLSPRYASYSYEIKCSDGKSVYVNKDGWRRATDKTPRDTVQEFIDAVNAENLAIHIKVINQ